MDALSGFADRAAAVRAAAQEVDAIARLKRDVLCLARDSDLSPAVVVAALADVIGITAAMTDVERGGRSLDDKMHVLDRRARDVYARMTEQLRLRG